ncbi:unnamed protein product [Adineta steineri]|uniref:G-protein coupled receptors family 1 profile domain-containing protein n=1 Tax=Adineta steineri TaxID=433720 RepID=A0A813YAD6_9BILA|nr:unnamed protein product [Adineta steineri]CAF0887254.1 unnamed protein product [Adineta steineri]
MSSDSSINLLTFFTNQITLYCPILIIIIGNIGCFCNFLTFTSPKLIQTSCSLYFLSAAIFDLLTLDYGALTRLLIDHFGSNLHNTSQIYCKIRQYLITVLPAIATCFIVLATMDRYFSTSSKQKYRSYATIKYAKWIVSLSLLICILSYTHYMIFYDLRPTCTFLPGVYSMFVVVYAIVWSSFIPHLLMLCFGFATHVHIHIIRRRIAPSTIQQRRKRRTEIQLVTMMLFQVGISSLLIFMRIAYYSYYIITTGRQKTDYAVAMGNFFSQLTTQLFYLNYAKSFYIYTLSSKYFRKIFKRRVLKILQKFLPYPLARLIINRPSLSEHGSIKLHTMHVRTTTAYP